ncbi:unnamed protein product [marine sediment metagenome]|uniref:Uncharacterized protein n=1 Tax=marine sediment metagenome TaxID=412755 RepID=X1TJA8_9ZZZZ
MQLQQPITHKFNEKRVGSICSMLVDKKNEGHIFSELAITLVSEEVKWEG